MKSRNITYKNDVNNPNAVLFLLPLLIEKRKKTFVYHFHGTMFFYIGEDTHTAQKYRNSGEGGETKNLRK